ncbi:hypothetical protein PFISCL1PPCAC_26132, partial [Pristionchus fissidentatus]
SLSHLSYLFPSIGRCSSGGRATRAGAVGRVGTGMSALSSASGISRRSRGSGLTAKAGSSRLSLASGISGCTGRRDVTGSAGRSTRSGSSRLSLASTRSVLTDGSTGSRRTSGSVLSGLSGEAGVAGESVVSLLSLGSIVSRTAEVSGCSGGAGRTGRSVGAHSALPLLVVRDGGGVSGQASGSTGTRKSVLSVTTRLTGRAWNSRGTSSIGIAVALSVGLSRVTTTADEGRHRTVFLVGGVLHGAELVHVALELPGDAVDLQHEIGHECNGEEDGHRREHHGHVGHQMGHRHRLYRLLR